jgi:hypothetical protein
MDDAVRDQLSEDAVRAARQAAREATIPEARLFLREHANFIARMVAKRRRERDRAAITFLMPLLEHLPV